MKKFVSFVLVVCTMFACSFFVSCKSKYDKLSMTFIRSGEQIDSLSLALDDSDNASARIGVKFSNIKSNLVGEIEVFSDNAKLVDIPKDEYQYDGNYCFFTVYAQTASKFDSKLIVRHLSSNRTSSIDLTVVQDATGLVVNKSNYIINSNIAGFHEIIAEDMISLNPISSTNEIVYKYVRVNSGNFNTKYLRGYEGNNSYFDGIDISEGTDEINAEITAYPAVVKSNGEIVEYESDVINIKIKKLLDEESLKLTSDDDHKPKNATGGCLDFDENATYTLIQNDNGTKTVGSDTYNFSNIFVWFNFDDNWKDIWQAYYSAKIETESPSLVVMSTDTNKFVIQAVSNTVGVETVKLSLNPKSDLVGEVNTICKEIKIQAESKADKIDVYKANKLTDANEDYFDIFDYYHSGNTNGTLFNFKPETNANFEVKSGLDKMVIEIELVTTDTATFTLLDFASEDGKIGKNCIYTNQDFVNRFTTSGYKRNKRALQFSIGSSPLRFYYDAPAEKLISEEFTPSNRIYIKYTTYYEADDVIANLSITVKTVNHTTETYLQGINPTEKTLYFSAQQGISDVDLVLYTVKKDSGKITTSPVKDDNTFIEECLYFDLNDSETKYALNCKQVTGVNKAMLTGAKLEFTVMAEDKQDGILKLAVWNTSSSIDHLLYNTFSVFEQNNYLLINFEGIQVGKYSVVISQKDTGFSKTYPLYIYKSLPSDKAPALLVAGNDYLIKNGDWTTDYYSDYMVAVGQTINVQLDIVEQIKNSFVEKIDYSVVAYKYDEKDKAYTEEIISDLLTSYTGRMEDDELSICFNRAYDGDCKIYIEIIFSLQCKAVNDCHYLKSSYANSYSNPVYLYVYHPINYEDLSLTVSNEDIYVYPEGLLKNTGKSTTTIGVKIDEGLAKYSTGVEWRDSKLKATNESDINETIGISFTSSGSPVIVTATVKQFDRQFVLTKTLTPKTPILTKKIVIESGLEYSYSNPYVNIKVGEEYVLWASNYSDMGIVTSPGYEVVVCTPVGSPAVNEWVKLESKNDGSTIIKCINAENAPKLKVCVFASDTLLNSFGSNQSFSNPFDFVYRTDEDQKAYVESYFTFDLILSNGSEENPFVIDSADDFWEIASNKDIQTSYFELYRDIDLKNNIIYPQKQIVDFEGNITSKDNVQYSLYNLKLDNDFANLFVNFKGNISWIGFDVEYSYNYTEAEILAKDLNLGVFDKNFGTLTCVSVLSSGECTFDQNNKTFNCNFGLLVGENTGDINYESSNAPTGTMGSITLEGNSVINFGGLVGKNSGTIVGEELKHSNITSDTIEPNIVLSINNQGIMSNLTIESKIENDNCLIGGIIGINYGDLQYARTSADISATKGIIGGAIGKNDRTDQSGKGVTVILDGSTLTDVELDSEYVVSVNFVVSKATIKGGTNVGGVVGQNYYGYLLDCQLQIIKANQISSANYVGGIVGESSGGVLKNCSTYSYRFTNHEDIGEDAEPDMSAAEYLGGIVGYAVNSNNSISSGEPIAGKVVVLYSSVNAYLDAEVGQVGGIACTNNETMMIYNAYFIGKLKGTTCETALTNKASATGTCYAIASINGSNVKNYFTNKPDYWGEKEEINNGKYFVANDKDGTEPIFEIAPTSLDVNVNGEVALKKLSGAGADDKCYIDFYDFSSVVNNATLLNSLNTEYNRYEVKKLFNFDYKPKGISTLDLLLTTSDINVISIIEDSGKVYLKITGVGECVLKFSSVLNPDVYDEVTVFVVLPVGDEITIDKGIESISMTKGESRKLTISTSGSKEFNSVKYKYKTLQNIGLDITATCGSESIEPKYYLKISGKEFDNEKCSIDETTPFVVSVIGFIETKFTLTINPFTNINGSKILFTLSKKLTVQIGKGATYVKLQNSESVIYPNDETIITLYLTTDINLISANRDISYLSDMIYSVTRNGEELEKDKYEQFLKLISYEYNPETWDSTIFYYDKDNKILVKKSDEDEYNHDYDYYLSDYDDGKQTVSFRFTAPVGIETKEEYTITFRTANGKNATTKFAVLPQRINNFDIKNYVASGDREIKIENVLKPSRKQNGAETTKNGGLIILDIVPDNAYFDYLEISDITGDEEIKFIQYSNYVSLSGSENTYYTNPNQSADGKGIELQIIKDDMRISKYYILTQISGDFSSKLHIIEVRAYVSVGDVKYLVGSATKNIDVKMLPSLSVDYRLPSGKSGQIAIDETKNNVDYAQNTDATFYVTKRNANGDITYKVLLNDKETQDYKIEKGIIEGYYYLKNVNYNSSISGTLSVVFTVRDYSEAGDYEETSAGFVFSLKQFVVHNVSITNTQGGVIYGNIDYPVDLEMYFAPTDVSARLNFYTSFAEKYSSGMYYNTTLGSTDIEASLNTILGELNQAGCLGFNFGKNASNGLITEKEINKVTYLCVNSDSGRKVQAKDSENVVAKLEYDSDNTLNKLTVYSNLDGLYLTLNYAYKGVDKNIEFTITQNYTLKFSYKTSAVEPKLIANAQDFLEMTSGESNYFILGTDIELENYNPIDIEIAEFDGNGRTITINSFAKFEEVEIKAGLFKHIYPNMVVKNVCVEYKTTSMTGEYSFGNAEKNSIEYYDLCNSPQSVDYTSAKFAGLTPENEGVITNCSSSGKVAFRASSVEAKVKSDYIISFYMSGLVCDNLSGGYITNSVSQMSLYGMANIAGFVYLNEGTLASCSVNDSVIYAYNLNAINITSNVAVGVSGFVYENSSKITMCCAEFYGNKTVSSKNSLAGFIFYNNGQIDNSYIVLEEIGENNHEFSGFVANNSGSISKSYSIISKGKKRASDIYMFAQDGMKNINNCLTFMEKLETSKIEGLNIRYYNSRTDKSIYKNLDFAFGDNASSVWICDGLKHPTLVSVDEKVAISDEIKDNKGDGTRINEKYEKYYGLQNISREEQVDSEGQTIYKYITNAGGYGSETNPIIIHNRSMYLSNETISPWQYYFTIDNANCYYRIVTDIDFSLLGKNPQSSSLEFKGNIQGNNMSITGMVLTTDTEDEVTDSIGLFKMLTGGTNFKIKNVVRNLTISPLSVWATKTKAVGVLAGICEDFKLYNISIDVPVSTINGTRTTIVGGNAVGGLAGIVRGNFDMEYIYSNANVTSTYINNPTSHAIYLSKTNGYGVSSNLGNVYYAGSVAGILDGYSKTIYYPLAEKYLSDYYFEARKISVYGDIYSIANIAGGAFGYVGDYVKLIDVNVELVDSSIEANNYAGGLVGENRGWICNSKIVINNSTTFAKTSVAVGGLVGLNLRGYIDRTSVVGDIIQGRGLTSIVGGFVGKNLYGIIRESSFDGRVFGCVSGNFIGEDVSNGHMTSDTYGAFSLGADSKKYIKNLGNNWSQMVIKMDKDLPPMSFDGLILTEKSIEKYLEYSDNYFQFKSVLENESGLEGNIDGYYSFGLIVGNSYNYSNDDVSKYSTNFKIGNKIVSVLLSFNVKFSGRKLVIDNDNGTIYLNLKYKENSIAENEVKIAFIVGNYFKDGKLEYCCCDKNIVTFTKG